MIGHILHSFVARGLVALVNFLILVISARYLGVSSRGEISIFLLNITVIQVINEIYTGYSLVHFIPRYNFRKIIITGIVFSVINCITLNFLLGSAGRQTNSYVFPTLVLSLFVVLHTFFCILLLGREKLKEYNRLSMLQPVLLLCGLLIWMFGFRTFTFEAYFFPLLISFSLAFIISMIALMNLQSRGNTEFRPGRIFLKGLYFQGAALMFIFANRYSFYLLPDVAQVGLYAAATVFMESVLIISAAISTVVLSRVANMPGDQHGAQIALSLAKASVLITLVLTAVLLIIPDRFYVFVLGEGFAGIRQLMFAYAPAVLMVSFFSILSQYFFASGKQAIVLLCYAAGFLHTVFRAPVLIRASGISGSAIAADISFLIMTVLVSAAFVLVSGISSKRFLSLREDYYVLKSLFSIHLPRP
jgi:O-antigen/teichoic acid export membrane protein